MTEEIFQVIDEVQIAQRSSRNVVSEVHDEIDVTRGRIEGTCCCRAEDVKPVDSVRAAEILDELAMCGDEVDQEDFRIHAMRRSDAVHYARMR